MGRALRYNLLAKDFHYIPNWFYTGAAKSKDPPQHTRLIFFTAFGK
jgi:hypothetical protein